MAQDRFDADLHIIANSDLEITQMDGDLNIIQKLSDEPNDQDGLTADQLKAKFDQAGLTIQSYINETLIPQVNGTIAVEAQRVANENQRQANEAVRQDNEAGRAAAETERGTAEAGRVSAETARGSAEAGRVSAETARAGAESDRVAAESGRASAETARGTAESGRVQAESGRVSAEAGRASAESARVTAENGRASAENDRVTAESGRASAENGRASAENARGSAESARVSAENSREQAETAREAAQAAFFQGVSASAEMLPQGSEATASAAPQDGSFHVSFGIPAGGPDGKSAYSYAVDGGYPGTEAEFQALMADAASRTYVDSELASKQNKLTGIAGQVVGFNAAGNAEAQNGVTETQLKIINGDLILTQKYVPREITGIAYGNELFAAVYGDNYGKIIKSADGVTWTDQAVPLDQYWMDIAYGYSFFLAVGPASKALLSFEGNTWEEISMPENVLWRSIAVKNGDFFVSGGNKIAKSFYVGLREIQFALVDTQVPFTPSKIKFGANNLVAVASGRAAYCANGTDWTEVSFPLSGTITGIAYGNGLFVAGCSEGIAYSPDDGLTWTKVGTLPTSIVGNVGITYGNGKFIAVSNGRILYSVDAVTWWYESFTDLYNTGVAAYGKDGFAIGRGDMGGRMLYKSDEKLTVGQVNAAIDAAITGAMEASY